MDLHIIYIDDRGSHPEHVCNLRDLRIWPKEWAFIQGFLSISHGIPDYLKQMTTFAATTIHIIEHFLCLAGAEWELPHEIIFQLVELCDILTNTGKDNMGQWVQSCIISGKCVQGCTRMSPLSQVPLHIKHPTVFDLRPFTTRNQISTEMLMCNGRRNWDSHLWGGPSQWPENCCH